MKGIFPVDKFNSVTTPFYYYDTELLRNTLSEIRRETSKYDGFCVHYAIKANANPKVLGIICQAGLGVDCVSGWEIQTALNAGFPAKKIVYAGVGKSDWEIQLGIDKDIFCFNVESAAELEVINDIAQKSNKVARVAFRINPDVGAHTHANITTGLAENKFGIAMADMENVILKAEEMKNVKLERHHIRVEHINVGGGLGIDYNHPNRVPMADFESYFKTYARHLKLRNGQTLHFELGRAVVAPCGTLITKCLYVKEGTAKKFTIVDAGMTDLIRPALYQAYHKIENISSEEPMETYDVVGPICESSDVFGKAVDLNACHRGDYIAIRSAGAYGEIMASCYNCRPMPKGYLSDEF